MYTMYQLRRQNVVKVMTCDGEKYNLYAELNRFVDLQVIFPNFNINAKNVHLFLAVTP